MVLRVFPCMISHQVGRMASVLEKWEKLEAQKHRLCEVCRGGSEGGEGLVHNKRYLRGDVPEG